MNMTVDVTSSESDSTSESSAGRRPSDAASASAVGDSAGAKEGCKQPTMRMPRERGTALAALGIRNVEASEHEPKQKVRKL